MPPRKPLSSRGPQVGARRGGQSADPLAPQPPGGPTFVGPDPSRSDTTVMPSLEYETGSDYPVPEDDDPYGPADGGYTGEEDLYGENDPWPDEEGEPSLPSHATGEVPRAPEVTRIAPIVLEEEEEDEDDDGQSTRAGPPIHLEVISGPDQGKTRRFRGVRMVIGRTAGCDFKLADNSVSRRHLELVLGDDGVLLRDLGSGNGTRVNDQKVNEKLLEDGDEISIGKTRFRFVDELAALRKRNEAAAQPAPEEESEAEASEEAAHAEADSDDAPDDSAPVRGPPAADEKTNAGLPPLSARRRPVRGARGRSGGLEPNQKKLLAIAGAAVALVLVIGLALSLKSPPPPPPNPNLEVAATKLQLARNALRDGKFAEAVDLVDQAEKLVPGCDATHLGDGARKELAAQQGFDAVRALFKSGDFDSARQKLRDVPLAVVLNEEARRKVEKELDDAENAYGQQMAVEALDARDAERAQAIIEKLPREMAQALTPKLEALKAELAQEQAEAEREQKQHKVAAARYAKQKREAYVDEAFAGVARKFHQGEFSRASLECDRVVATHRGDAAIRSRAIELKKLMPLFGHYLEDGQRKYRQGALDAAARPLRKAKALYEKIGFDGALGPMIDEQLAAASLSAAKSAMQRNDLASAADHFREALKLNPNETRAQQGLEAVNHRAEELYLDGYMIRDREPREAADKFRIVMDVLPKGSETYEKAKNQLAALGQ